MVSCYMYYLIKKSEESQKSMEEAYWAERRGRTRVEQEMKRLAEVQLNTSEGFFVQPVGAIESCYRQCVGTPRQGMLVPKSRAAIALSSNMSAEAFDGLEEFSHVWLTFKFHLNTNTLKEARAFQGVMSDVDSKEDDKDKEKDNNTDGNSNGNDDNEGTEGDSNNSNSSNISHGRGNKNKKNGNNYGKKKYTFTAKITPPMLKEKKGVREYR